MVWVVDVVHNASGRPSVFFKVIFQGAPCLEKKYCAKHNHFSISKFVEDFSFQQSIFYNLLKLWDFFCAGAFIKKNEKSFIRDYYSKGKYIHTYLSISKIKDYLHNQFAIFFLLLRVNLKLNLKIWKKNFTFFSRHSIILDHHIIVKAKK